MRISDVFDIEYPKTLIYAEMIPDSDGINFVSSQGSNNGVVGKVKVQDGIKIYPAGIITVPLKGTVLAAHVQAEPCYVAHQIAVLYAKMKLSISEKLFYCMCITQNAYRFSYGRQADKTIKDIELPDYIPGWVGEEKVEAVSTIVEGTKTELSVKDWKEYKLKDLFTIQYGINMELINCELTTADDPESVNFVARTANNNGVAAQVKRHPCYPPQPAGIMTCAGGGSVLSTFVQNKPFYSGRDLYLLIPKYEMSLYAKLFCCTVIEANKYRYSYGRQANRTMPDIILKLPGKEDGTPDFKYMENYMRTLPYSDRIEKNGQ